MYIVFTIIIFTCIDMVNGDPFEYKLISDLMQNYSTLARPSRKHNQPTQVYIGFSLYQIINVVI